MRVSTAEAPASRGGQDKEPSGFNAREVSRFLNDRAFLNLDCAESSSGGGDGGCGGGEGEGEGGGGEEAETALMPCVCRMGQDIGGAGCK